MHANMNQVTDAMAMADIGAVLKFLDGEPVRKGPKGSIGYCLGGRLSLAAAAEFPDKFRASREPARHRHGVSDAPESPHRSIGRMRGEIYCGFGEQRRFTPPPVRRDAGAS